MLKLWAVFGATNCRDLMGRLRPRPQLTHREWEVVALLAAGSSMREIASVLGIAYRTVAFHKYGIMRRNGMTTNAELLRYAFETDASERRKRRRRHENG
jgi:DNA-binding CsgD family transcriptional regulator